MLLKLPLLLAPLIAAALVAGAPAARAQDGIDTAGIKGAGSTFAYPVMARWSREYRLAQAGTNGMPAAESGLDTPAPNTALDYEPVGSLAGSLRVKAGAVDFGASDVPTKSAELARHGLGQFPVVIGGIVAVVNVDGVATNQLRFTGPVLAGIFLGTISRWSDPAIRALNPGLRLPDAKIEVVHRSDGSGTTFNFTDYLSKVSPAWKQRVGSDLLVAWPTGRGAKGNEGVARAVGQLRNSIGYVDYAQALQAGLAVALLQNRAGRFVQPGPESFGAAAAQAEWRPAGDFDMLLTDAPGDNAYPVVASVFVLMPIRGPATRVQATLGFFRWSLEQGAGHAARLGYVPLPAALVGQVRSYWSRVFKSDG